MVVEEVGAGVHGFAPGDRVFGLCEKRMRTHAEYALIPQGDMIAHMPENLTFEQAAGTTEGFFLAISCYNRVGSRQGDDVLVYGASGSIGSAAAVQIAVNMGMNVTAVCGTNTVALISSLGPDDVIDYQTEDFTAIDKKFDLVFDAVGKRSYFETKHLLKPNGVYCGTDFGPYLHVIWMMALTWWRKKGRRVLLPVPSYRIEDLDMLKGMAGRGLVSTYYRSDI